MKDKERFANRGISAITLIFLSALVIITGLAFSKIEPYYMLAVLFSAAVFLIAVLKTDVALVILIFSMLLSPELRLAEIPGREVVLRLDDLLLFVVFFGWLAKMAINKELGLLRHTPLNRFIISYIVVCII
ncbi:MAG TPA: hypothetical protein ENN78_02610, partial [Candidatus Omnitrophica bacterium]|nr:hypothetical protein [Candidatus Omnitrophota bacterium]